MCFETSKWKTEIVLKNSGVPLNLPGHCTLMTTNLEGDWFCYVGVSAWLLKC